MQVYQTNDQGVFVGVVNADPNPLDTTDWLIPAGCVTTAPPSYGPDEMAMFANGGWSVLPVPNASPDSNPEPVPAPQVSKMQVSKMQGILALGETRWAQVLAYRETATWGEKVVIDSAADWHRDSQSIAFFQHLIGLTDAETDALFIAAAQITQ